MGQPQQQPLLDEEAALEADAPGTVVEEFETYVRLRGEFEEADEVATEKKRIYKAQEVRLWNLMESLELKSFSHDYLGKATRVNKVIAKVVDEEELQHHLIDLGLYEEFRAWRWAQAKLNEHVKESLEKDGVPPPGLDAFTPIELRYSAPKPAATARRVEIED